MKEALEFLAPRTMEAGNMRRKQNDRVCPLLIPQWFEVEELPTIGAVRILDIGEENFYFLVCRTGRLGYAKYHG